MPNPTNDNSLQGLYAQLKAQLQNNEQHPLLQALHAVNQYVSNLRKPDRYNRIPYVTEQNKQDLIQLHQQVAAESEKLLKSTDNEEVQKVMEKIFSLSSANFTNISAYDPAATPKSIDTIDEDFRALHLDMPENESGPNQVGKTLSKRKMVTFLDEKGRKVSGVFTEKPSETAYYTILSKLDELKRLGGGSLGQSPLANFLANASSARPKLPEDSVLKDDDFHTLYSIMSNVTDYDPENQGYRVNSNKLKAYMAKIYHTSQGSIVNQVGADNMQKLESILDQYATQVMVNMAEAGISDGSRLDSRNAAMCAVADLFGMPNLLARSRPMKLTVRDEKGKPKVLEGSFMTEAKGVDLNNLATKPERLNANSLVDTDGKAIQQLADLQVLDFICGNVDRHMGNIFYQLDKNGKLTGIVGIDNDCSFGEFVPKDGESRRRLAGLDNMRVMSRSMADKIMAMKAPTLKYALRGYGLSEKQLDAACERLELTQKAIEKSIDNPVVGEKNGKPVFEKGRIRILDDKDFKEVDMKDLVVNTDKKGVEAPKGKEFGNIFSCAYTGITDTKNRQYSQTNYKVERRNVLNTKNRCRLPGLENAVNAAKATKDSLGSVSYFRSSGKYRDMQRAAIALHDYQNSILTRIRYATGKDVVTLKDYKQHLNAVVKPKEVEKMVKLAQKLEKAAESYLKYKGISDKSKAIGDYSTYTQSRIQSAIDARSMAKDFNTLLPEEADLAKVSERQAKEALARVTGDAKDPVTKNQQQNLQDQEKYPKPLQAVK